MSKTGFTNIASNPFSKDAATAWDPLVYKSAQSIKSSEIKDIFGAHPQDPNANKPGDAPTAGDQSVLDAEAEYRRRRLSSTILTGGTGTNMGMTSSNVLMGS